MRAGFFAEAISLHLKDIAFAGTEIEHHPKISSVMAEAFFALTDAYERRHLNAGKKIEPVKQAALTCAVICCVMPLRPVLELVDREELIYINPMLAMRAACAIIAHPFHRRAFDEQRRHYRLTQSLSLPSLAPLLDEANTNDCVLTSNFELDLKRDERDRLNGLVNYFTVLKELKIYTLKAEADEAAPGDGTG